MSHLCDTLGSFQTPSSFQRLTLLVALVLGAHGTDGLLSRADEDRSLKPSQPAPPPPAVIFMTVPLPITGDVDAMVIQRLDRALSRIPATNERPLVVLEFRADTSQRSAAARARSSTAPNVSAKTPPVNSPPADAPPANQPLAIPPEKSPPLPPDSVVPKAAGTAASSETPLAAGSQFERSLALARHLTSERLRTARTIAYVPGSLSGHAILPVLACEELIVGTDAELLDAGEGEAFIDPAVRAGYEEIASRRRTIPGPAVMGLLDRSLAVFRVRTAEGWRFVDQMELEKLRGQSAVLEIETIKPSGDRGRFTGRDMRRKFAFASHEAAERVALAAALRVPVDSLANDPSLDDGWRPLRVDLAGPLNARQLNWNRRSIESWLRSGNRNLIVVVIESPGGSLVESLGFAAFLSELPDDVRTVAYVAREARADAAIIALACDQLVVSDAALLGGPGAEQPEPETLNNIVGPLEAIARPRGRPWSWSAAMVDSRVELRAFENAESGQQRWMSERERQMRDDREAWRPGAPLPTAAGLSGRRAREIGMAQHAAEDFAAIRDLYPFADEPQMIAPNWAHRFIESLASPRIAGLLLFIAWFALVVEFVTPNLTGAGLLSALCFMLYFWSQFLHGNAGWLEVLLFLAGAICLAIEIFVLPGFGKFGLVGGALIISSLVLASQTFIIPRNAYQLSRLPTSLWTVVAALAGVVTGAVLLRRLLPHTPLVRGLMLQPPVADTLLELDRRETLADRSHLRGQTGVAATPLMPGGKASFGNEVVDVVSEGEPIERGAAVRVVDTLGNRVIVRPC
jgi:membrane-bound serine protease (ClpP class)